MIEFKTVSLRNFFSIGDNPLVIELNKEPLTLVSGENGAGKSVSIVDSICFGLFGKSYKKVNKSEIVNKINGKQCVVEIEFIIGDKNYKVVRGIKPNIFEIYKNDELLDQSANIKDYQKYLEENILHLNFESFKQVVILSSSSFIPFMELTTSQRRSIIEDILDIEIFSKMNVILKEKLSLLKSEYSDTDREIIHLQDQIGRLKSTIDSLEAANKENEDEKNEQILKLKKELEEKQLQYSKKSKPVFGAVSIFEDKKNKIDYDVLDRKNKQSRLTLENQTNQKTIDDTKSWLRCNSCNQIITDEMRNDIISKLEISIKTNNKFLIEIQESLSKSIKEQTTLNFVGKKLQEEQNKLSGLKTEINMTTRRIDEVEKEIQKAKSSLNVHNTEKLKQDLIIIKDKNKKQTKKFEIASKELTYHKFSLDLLKDDGIKAKVIEQYLPIINERINYYLDTLNFFVSFNLDENFNETIKRGHIDNQDYASLSQGEKQRIDLSLLFTWRDVAKMKNSINTNLLILDETFDSSLSASGVEDLKSVLDMFDHNTNIFVISHKGEQLENRISNHFIFEKKGNFTTMRINND